MRSSGIRIFLSATVFTLTIALQRTASWYHEDAGKRSSHGVEDTVSAPEQAQTAADAEHSNEFVIRNSRYADMDLLTSSDIGQTSEMADNQKRQLPASAVVILGSGSLSETETLQTHTAPPAAAAPRDAPSVGPAKKHIMRRETKLAEFGSTGGVKPAVDQEHPLAPISPERRVADLEAGADVKHAEASLVSASAAASAFSNNPLVGFFIFGAALVCAVGIGITGGIYMADTPLYRRMSGSRRSGQLEFRPPPTHRLSVERVDDIAELASESSDEDITGCQSQKSISFHQFIDEHEVEADCDSRKK